MTQYDEKIAVLQKKVQMNPLDHVSWMEMIRLCDEAIAADVDRERWQKARRTMVVQASLMGVVVDAKR